MSLSVSLAEASAYLDALDLTYLIDTMCGANYPLPRWTRVDAEECCRRYKRFLLLQKQYLPTSLVPTKQIDEFWHNHILHTNAYFTDCERIFGHYLHHLPASPTDEPTQLVHEFNRTKQLYEEVFKEPYLGL